MYEMWGRGIVLDHVFKHYSCCGITITQKTCTRNFIVYFSLVIQFVEDMDCSSQSIQLVSLTKLHKTKMFANYVFGSNETVCCSGPGWVMNGPRSVGDPVH